MDGKLKPLSEAAADQHAKGLVSSSSRMDGRRAVSVYGSDTNWKNQILPADKTRLELLEQHDVQSTRLRALADFIPAPGVIFEIPLNRGDELELFEQEAPEGWIFVSNLNTGLEGLVPETFLEEVADEEDDVAGAEEEEQEDGGREADVQKEGDADADADAAIAKPPKVELTEAEREKLAEEKALRDTKRIAIVAFHPEPGSVWEMPLEPDEIVELAPVNWEVPDGWLTVRKEGSASDEIGLVPMNLVAHLPEPEGDDGPSLEEQKAQVERELFAARQAKKKTEEVVEQRERELAAEKEQKEVAERLREEKELKVKEAEKREEALEKEVKQLAVLKDRETDLLAQVETLENKADAANKIDVLVKRELTRLVMAASETQQREEERRQKRAEARAVLEKEAFEKQRRVEAAMAEVESAEKAYEMAEREVKRAEFERSQAFHTLTEARRVLHSAQREQKEEELQGGPKLQSERALERLIPGVRRLLQPKPSDLDTIAEDFPQQVLNLAEEAARRKLGMALEAEKPTEKEAMQEDLMKMIGGGGGGGGGTGGVGGGGGSFRAPPPPLPSSSSSSHPPHLHGEKTSSSTTGHDYSSSSSSGYMEASLPGPTAATFGSATAAVTTMEPAPLQQSAAVNPVTFANEPPPPGAPASLPPSAPQSRAGEVLPTFETSGLFLLSGGGLPPPYEPAGSSSSFALPAPLMAPQQRTASPAPPPPPPPTTAPLPEPRAAPHARELTSPPPPRPMMGGGGGGGGGSTFDADQELTKHMAVERARQALSSQPWRADAEATSLLVQEGVPSHHRPPPPIAASSWQKLRDAYREQAPPATRSAESLFSGAGSSGSVTTPHHAAVAVDMYVPTVHAMSTGGVAAKKSRPTAGSRLRYIASREMLNRQMSMGSTSGESGGNHGVANNLGERGRVMHRSAPTLARSTSAGSALPPASGADISHALALNRRALLSWQKRMQSARQVHVRELPPRPKRRPSAPSTPGGAAVTEADTTPARAFTKQHASLLALPRHPSMTALKHQSTEKVGFTRSTDRFG